MSTEEEVVPYVQRRLPQAGPAHAPDGLHDLLFYPIAGDSMAPDTELRAPVGLRWLQFGILDAEGVHDQALLFFFEREGLHATSRWWR